MTTWDLEEGISKTWTYNDLNLSYNQNKDSLSGDDVLYNSMGVATTWTLQTRN